MIPRRGAFGLLFTFLGSALVVAFQTSDPGPALTGKPIAISPVGAGSGIAAGAGAGPGGAAAGGASGGGASGVSGTPSGGTPSAAPGGSGAPSAGASTSPGTGSAIGSAAGAAGATTGKGSTATAAPSATPAGATSMPRAHATPAPTPTPAPVRATPVPATPAPTPALAVGAYRDGTYDGTGEQIPWGVIAVRVTISGGRIVDVTPTSLSSGGRSTRIDQFAVPILHDEALAAQSANINMVSGATWTSQGYAASLQSALDSARV